ncbi:MAG: M23 family metallopeptidase [Erythrobacter sp.]|uniref:M23 family metallopeptidase n=1 Tax=Erythrobacter sp. TaxID=1042 RepID=UPI003C74BC3F
MNTLHHKRLTTKLATGLGTAALVLSGAPALANSSANAAAAPEVREAAKDAQGDSLSTGDVRFRELFASWTSLDRDGPGAPLEQPTIAVPSIMPLDGARMSSSYGMRRHPVLRKRKRHNGIDLAAPTGTPIYATADGIVGRADHFSSYGLYVSIDHGAELETRYAHMSRIAVSAGERVRKGDVIGYVGSTGRSTGPHLHYEVRVEGVAVNPIPYMVETDIQIAMEEDMDDLAVGGL